MSVHKYNEARNKALKTMTLGLVFLIFLPIGIPVSLIIIPFLAGRNGARNLPDNWHLTYILTVGGGWSIGLVLTLIILLSIALGPALRINITEIFILTLIILFTWASFTVGVTSSKINSSRKESLYEKEWREEEASNSMVSKPENESVSNNSEDEHLRTMAVHSDKVKNQSNYQKMKNFLTGATSEQVQSNEGNVSKNDRKVKKKSKKGKASRVSALANRRRK